MRSIRIDLPELVHAGLADVADRSGLTVEDLVLEAVRVFPPLAAAVGQAFPPELLPVLAAPEVLHG